ASREPPGRRRARPTDSSAGQRATSRPAARGGGAIRRLWSERPSTGRGSPPGRPPRRSCAPRGWSRRTHPPPGPRGWRCVPNRPTGPARRACG
ncbi:MAG: arylsulfatase, partial [Phycisphaerae bacterium]